MTTWEYLTLKMHLDNDVAKELGSLGGEGWELTGTVQLDSYGTRAMFVFKRPIMVDPYRG